ncbi:hypothetical protein N0V94_001921 [Neodidymelliopsis sp. IMI 364377]|nr:hypothetical protein N0V94_001921 [Neodidymelliopsis sp. IMI 364377]
MNSCSQSTNELSPTSSQLQDLFVEMQALIQEKEYWDRRYHASEETKRICEEEIRKMTAESQEMVAGIEKIEQDIQEEQRLTAEIKEATKKLSKELQRAKSEEAELLNAAEDNKTKLHRMKLLANMVEERLEAQKLKLSRHSAS